MVDNFQKARADLNNGQSEEYDEIDQYLDGRLPEKEAEDFERRCFSDDALLLKLQERQKFDEQLAGVINEKGYEIFSDYFKNKLDGIMIEAARLLVKEVAPNDLPLFDHFEQKYRKEDPEERPALVWEAEYRSTTGEAAPKLNLTMFVLLVVESMMQSLREKSPEKLQTITPETMKEFLQQHARELLEHYRELTKSYSAEILQQVEKFAGYLKKLLAS